MGGSQSKVTSQKLYDSYIKDATKLDDLSGKVVAITGTSPGSIGFYIAEAAVKKNAKLVLLLNRQSERSVKADQALNEMAKETTKIKTIHIDLLSFDSVKKAAEEVNRLSTENGGLDILACNAGIMAMNDDRTVDGFNVEIQACHLSHAMLTKQCMSSLQQAAETRDEARVIFQSSMARYGDDLEKKYFEKCEPNTLGGSGNTAWKRYHNAKLANSAFAMALHDSLKEKDSKVKSIGCEPGYSTSGLQNTSQNTGRMMLSMLNAAAAFGAAQSPADGSLPASVACFGPGAESGDFYFPKGKNNLKGEPIKSIEKGRLVKKGKDEESVDLKNKQLIMGVTAEALGISSFL